jgi:hypothetical protein
METIMKRRQFSTSLLLLGISAWLAPNMAVAGEVLQSVTTFVRGEILQIDGPYYTIRDESGREIRLQVDGTTTKTDDSFYVGDRIAVDVTPRGHAGLMLKEPGR